MISVNNIFLGCEDFDTFCPTYVTDPSHWPMFCKDNDKYTSIACRKTCKFCISSHEGIVGSHAFCVYLYILILSLCMCAHVKFHIFFNPDVVTTKKSTQKPTEIKTTITTEAPNVEGKHRLSFVLIQI